MEVPASASLATKSHSSSAFAYFAYLAVSIPPSLVSNDSGGCNPYRYGLRKTHKTLVNIGLARVSAPRYAWSPLAAGGEKER